MERGPDGSGKIRTLRAVPGWPAWVASVMDRRFTEDGTGCGHWASFIANGCGVKSERPGADAGPSFVFSLLI